MRPSSGTMRTRKLRPPGWIGWRIVWLGTGRSSMRTCLVNKTTISPVKELGFLLSQHAEGLGKIFDGNMLVIAESAALLEAYEPAAIDLSALKDCPLGILGPMLSLYALTWSFKFSAAALPLERGSCFRSVVLQGSKLSALETRPAPAYPQSEPS